jgi:hypothetical protein
VSSNTTLRHLSLAGCQVSLGNTGVTMGVWSATCGRPGHRLSVADMVGQAAAVEEHHLHRCWQCGHPCAAYQAMPAPPAVPACVTCRPSAPAYQTCISNAHACDTCASNAPADQTCTSSAGACDICRSNAHAWSTCRSSATACVTCASDTPAHVPCRSMLVGPTTWPACCAPTPH